MGALRRTGVSMLAVLALTAALTGCARPAGYTTGDAKVAAVSGRHRIDVPLPPDPPPRASRYR